jgi:thiol:disulfide interchange protein DsbD
MKKFLNSFLVDKMDAAPRLRWFSSLCGLALFLEAFAGVGAGATPVKQPHLTAELISAASGVRAGTPTLIAVRLTLERKWHVYWRNSGDSGEPVRVTWSVPDTATVGPLMWPVPKRIVNPPLTSFGYEDRIVLPAELSVASRTPAGKPLALRAQVSWLVCAEVCIPGKASLALDLPVTAEDPAATRWRSEIEAARQQVPVADSSWSARAEAGADAVVLTVQGPADGVTGAYFFPYSADVLKNGQAETFQKTASGLSLTLAKSSRFAPAAGALDGVLALDGAARAIELSPAFVPAAAASPRVTASAAAGGSVFEALLFAFLGGMILNLMPCVFPVLFIKVLNFVEMAGSQPRKALMHGVVYSAGVLVCFWVLSGVLLILRASGQQLGWGFQLQSPIFLAMLCFLLLAMALNLMGLFEIGTTWMGLGQSLAAREGYAGSFFSGALAVVVATPCTAPFMGAAMGFALAHSAVVSFAVFTALGAGLSFPYVLLSAFPQLTRRLPKPGAWMVTFKQLMSFPLLATVIWLLWVLGLQTDLGTVVRILGAMLGLSLALWAYGKPSRYPRFHVIASLFLVVIAVFLGIRGMKATANAPSAASEAGSDSWQDFSEANLAKALGTGRPVFINFTAAWCITCQVNERVVFEAPAVKRKFAEKKVLLMKGDWTNQNDEIAKRLEKYGRDGVPLYVLYRAGQSADPSLLPQLLTPEGLIQELDKL